MTATRLELPSHQAIAEPSLQFHPDRPNDVDTHPLRGLKTFGPYSRGMPSAVSDPVRLAFVCPQGTSPIVARLIDELSKVQRPRERRDYLVEYPGFAQWSGVRLAAPPKGSPEIVEISRADADRALAAETPYQAVAELVHRALRSLHAVRTRFDVAVLYLPDDMAAAYRSPASDPDADFDLHDSVKAFCSGLGFPVQVLNDRSMNYLCRCSVAWRLSLALYVKAGGTPWKLAAFPDDHAYVGLGFCLRKSGDARFVTCCSQVFDHQGASLQFLLYESADGRYEGKNPYLPREDMHRLMTRTLSLYQRQKGRPPKRIVVHKTTPFDAGEIDGCNDALSAVDDLELLTVTAETPWRGIRIDRPAVGTKGAPAAYPIRRGTILPTGPFDFLLWTAGSVSGVADRDFYKEGKGIPRPLHVVRHQGRGGFHQPSLELLGLTKMNWNNDALYDQMPVTVIYSSVLAQVVKRLGALAKTPYELRYFM